MTTPITKEPTSRPVRHDYGCGERTHVHRRDWRPCPALYPPPLRPSKPVAVWLYRFADAVLHLETFTAFISEFPAEFAAGDPVR